MRTVLCSAGGLSANTSPGRILFIDAFDSFTNNIVGLLEQSLEAQVTVVHIDDQNVSKHLRSILNGFDAVVVGPGPGHPANPTDVGLINQLWALEDDGILPVFGICLGFQSLSLAYGAQVTQLTEPHHGIVSDIHHNGSDIFKNIGKIHATLYHSLHAKIAADCRIPTWEPSMTCPLLQPLAWDINGVDNGPVLMAVKHTQKPFWGVQFHPESICTSPQAAIILQNWWNAAQDWSFRHKRHVEDTVSHFISEGSMTDDSTSECSESEDEDSAATAGKTLCKQLSQSISLALRHSTPGLENPSLRWTTHLTSSITPIALCEALGLTQQEVVLLDSQNHPSGQFSMLGVVIPGETLKVTYQTWNRTLSYENGTIKKHTARLESIEQLWSLLQDITRPFDPRQHNTYRQASENPPTLGCPRETPLPDKSPFWGGFMGYISYEAGLETIQVELHESCSSTAAPDVNFAFIHRSIVIDHVTGRIHVQSLSSSDQPWIESVEKIIKSLGQDLGADNAASVGHLTSAPSLNETDAHKKVELEKRLRLATIKMPAEIQYRRKVLDCQDWLRSGDSYELCLTDETRIDIPRLDGRALDPWMLYKKLRCTNPAPFGAFLRLSGATVVGSSPERFLSWNRKGHCQLRPIKGTVKKSPMMTREKAHEILNSSKEQAENLMIVDLIRHDLSGIVGAKNCKVSKLMTVEEYETVYQLVSVIEGQIPRGSDKTGLDILKASLPPGSMTGAPKKRSCEILRGIEQRPRGIYSGVLGYLDVGGGGDFSVVIRTAIQGSSADKDVETWHIGAGGAVTVQSSDLDEFLEMETKVTSALGAFTKVEG